MKTDFMNRLYTSTLLKAPRIKFEFERNGGLCYRLLKFFLSLPIPSTYSIKGRNIFVVCYYLLCHFCLMTSQNRIKYRLSLKRSMKILSTVLIYTCNILQNVCTMTCQNRFKYKLSLQPQIISLGSKLIGKSINFLD